MSRGRRPVNFQGAEPRADQVTTPRSRLTDQDIDRENSHHDRANGVETSISKRPPSPDVRLMPFGKHRGLPIREVPIGYLVWLARQDGSSTELAEWIEPFILAYYQRQAALPAPVPCDPGSTYVRSPNRKPRALRGR